MTWSLFCIKHPRHSRPYGQYEVDAQAGQKGGTLLNRVGQQVEQHMLELQQCLSKQQQKAV